MEKKNNDQIIAKRLEEINELISPYRLAWVDPKNDCELLEKNARYMSKETLERLTENIRQDGFLSQIPFGIKQENGKYQIISGNHRVKAAIRAKQKRVLILFGIESDFDKNKRLAVQLSHNAIVGDDDKDILKGLYLDIDDILCKEYTGLIDEIISKYEPTNLFDISIQEIPLHELRFTFCLTDREYVQKVLDHLEIIGDTPETNAVVIGDIDRFVDAVSLVKKQAKVKDRSLALLRMCQICEDYMRSHSPKLKP